MVAVCGFQLFELKHQLLFIRLPPEKDELCLDCPTTPREGKMKNSCFFLVFKNLNLLKKQKETVSKQFPRNFKMP